MTITDRQTCRHADRETERQRDRPTECTDSKSLNKNTWTSLIKLKTVSFLLFLLSQQTSKQTLGIRCLVYTVSLHTDTMTQWYNDRHNDTMTQWQTQWHNDTQTQLHNDTMTQWHTDTMTRLHNDRDPTVIRLALHTVTQPVLGKVKVNVDLYSALSKALRYGTRSQGISQFYLHAPHSYANRMNHTGLCLPSRSWYSFADP